MGKKIFAAFLALFMLLQIPAVVDAFADFGVHTTAEAATYKLKKPVISKLSNVSGGVKVQWGKVSGASNYRVFYKTSSSGSWKTAGTTTSTACTVKGLSSGKTYWFTVRCVSKSGKTATSGYDRTGEKIRYIAKPVIKSLSNTSDGVKITWGKVAGAAKYRVLLKTADGWKKIADTASTSYTYKTSSSGKKYTFSVRCVSSTGKSCTSYYDTTGKAVTFIAKPVIRSVANTASGVKVTWKAVGGAYKYRVLIKTEGSTTWKTLTDTAKNGYTCKTLRENQSARFTVRCIDENGNYVSAYDSDGTKAVRITPPVITRQPKDEYLRPGETSWMYVETSVTAQSYAWYYRDAGGKFQKDPGQTGYTYKVSMNPSMDEREVYCEVTAADGTKAKSDIAKLWLIRDFDVYGLYGGTLEITRYLGSDTDIVVPSTLYGAAVTQIGDSVFCDSPVASEITGIQLPDSVQSIGVSTFRGCSKLQNIHLPEQLTIIGQDAFHGCRRLAGVNFPSGLKAIGSGAFAGCTALSEISLPRATASVGKGAFSGCTALRTAVLSDKMTAVQANTFSGCSALSDVTLPASLKAIESAAFAGCTALKTIDLPDTVSAIGTDALDKNTVIGCSQNSYADKWARKYGFAVTLH